MVELRIQTCLYYYEDKAIDGDDSAAALDLRDAVERLLPLDEGWAVFFFAHAP